MRRENEEKDNFQRIPKKADADKYSNSNMGVKQLQNYSQHWC